LIEVKILTKNSTNKAKMQSSNLYFTLFQKISEHLTILLNIQSKKKAGRPPKVSDLQLAALYITSYISSTPILTLSLLQKSKKLLLKIKTDRINKNTQIKIM
jgi:hypothetical protein